VEPRAATEIEGVGGRKTRVTLRNINQRAIRDAGEWGTNHAGTSKVETPYCYFPEGTEGKERIIKKKMSRE